MSNEKMREDFIKWFKSFADIDVLFDDGGQAFAIDQPITYGDKIVNTTVDGAWQAWQASRAAPDGCCLVPNETIKRAYALASSVCGDCYAGEDTESILANQLTKEISKSYYWMRIK